MNLQQLVDDFNQLPDQWMNCQRQEARLVKLRHQQQRDDNPQTLLAPMLAADGWLLTNFRRLRLPAQLQENEFALAGEAKSGDCHMQLQFDGQQLLRHDWHLTTSGDGDEYLAMAHQHYADGDQLKKLHYLRLYNLQGQLVAALFNGGEE